MYAMKQRSIVQVCQVRSAGKMAGNVKINVKCKMYLSTTTVFHNNKWQRGSIKCIIWGMYACTLSVRKGGRRMVIVRMEYILLDLFALCP